MIIIEIRMAFEDYNEVFDFICEMDGGAEDGKLFYLPFETGNNWSFVTYPPERVNELYQLDSLTEPSLREAYEGQWRLLEICDGDYANPRYVPPDARR